MKQFDCATLVPGVERIIRADTEAAVVARSVDFLKTVLGQDNIGPTLASEIKSRISEGPQRPH